MFSHIIVGARDLDRLGFFYDTVLGALGWVRQPTKDDGGPAGLLWTIPERPLPEFWVQIPWNGIPATWGNGNQVGFLANSPAEVEKAFELAMKCGGSDEGAPGYRPNYGASYFGAYCRDPEGNKLCFVHGISDGA